MSAAQDFGPPARATYFLATGTHLASDELYAFVVERGGEWHQDRPWCGFSTHGGERGGLAIEWATEEKRAWLRRLDGLTQTTRPAREARDALARMTEILGAPPHDFVELSPLGEEGQELAAAFVEAFAERWAPCALESAYPLDVAEGGRKVWTMDEVLGLARAEHRLPGLRTGVRNWFAYLLELYRAEQAEEAALGGWPGAAQTFL